jgi:hypothetical protein
MCSDSLVKYLLLFFVPMLESCDVGSTNNIYNKDKYIEVDLEGDSRDQLDEYRSKLNIYYTNELFQMYPPVTDTEKRFSFVRNESNSTIIGVNGFELTADGTRIVRNAVRWLGSANSSDGFEGWILTRNRNGVLEIVGIAISGGPMFR